MNIIEQKVNMKLVAWQFSLISCLFSWWLDIWHAVSADTENDLEDYDLEVNAVTSYAATSIAPKQYKSFQPSIKIQPSDLVYREEHSRAAPRKGIEVIVSLVII